MRTTISFFHPSKSCFVFSCYTVFPLSLSSRKANVNLHQRCCCLRLWPNSRCTSESGVRRGGRPAPRGCWGRCGRRKAETGQDGDISSGRRGAGAGRVPPLAVPGADHGVAPCGVTRRPPKPQRAAPGEKTNPWFLFCHIFRALAHPRVCRRTDTPLRQT